MIAQGPRRKLGLVELALATLMVLRQSLVVGVRGLLGALALARASGSVGGQWRREHKMEVLSALVPCGGHERAYQLAKVKA